MNKEQVEKAIKIFEENFEYCLSSKEELKANIEGVMTLINIVDPNNKEIIEFAKQTYRDIVNKGQ